MRMKSLVAILTALAAFGLAAPQPASADEGPAEAAHRAPVQREVQRDHRATHYRGLWPGGPDPYAYSYQRSSYYPYYDSRYWVPRAEMRNRTHYPFRIPEYTSSWGYPLSCKVQGRRNCGVPYERSVARHHF